MERQTSTEPGVNTTMALEISAKSSGLVQLKQVLTIIKIHFFNISA